MAIYVCKQDSGIDYLENVSLFNLVPNSNISDNADSMTDNIWNISG